MLTSPSSAIVIFAPQSFPMSVHDLTAVHESDTVTSAHNVPVPWVNSIENRTSV
jgi:hypothetical protein